MGGRGEQRGEEGGGGGDGDFLSSSALDAAQPGDTHCVQNPCCSSAVEGTCLLMCLAAPLSTQHGREKQAPTYRKLCKQTTDE